MCGEPAFNDRKNDRIVGVHIADRLTAPPTYQGPECYRRLRVGKILSGGQQFGAVFWFDIRDKLAQVGDLIAGLQQSRSHLAQLFG